MKGGIPKRKGEGMLGVLWVRVPGDQVLSENSARDPRSRGGNSSRAGGSNKPWYTPPTSVYLEVEKTLYLDYSRHERKSHKPLLSTPHTPGHNVTFDAMSWMHAELHSHNLHNPSRRRCEQSESHK